MSGIAGIFYRDGRPVEPTLLTRMTDVIAHRGPDGVEHWVDGSVGLGHRMLQTTPESLNEQQPLLDETGRFCLVMDGRIDNRNEIVVTLKARGEQLRTNTDAEIVLKSFLLWGWECPKQIIGDFVFAIWDRQQQELFCARDVLGIKPFYYYLDSNLFLFGSELHQLFENKTLRCVPNEGMVGEYLSSTINHAEETLCQSVLRLPPAHFMVINQAGVQKRRYWDIDPSKKIHYSTDLEYADHFLDIFKEAIRCRLRSHKPIGIFLSGGLDSSAIAAICQTFSPAISGSRLETFSMYFPQAPECDESKYIEEMLKTGSFKSHYICPPDATVSWYAQQARRYSDFPDYPNGTMVEPLFRLAQKEGFRVILTGDGADEWLTGTPIQLADLLRNAQLGEWSRQMQRELHYSEGGLFSLFALLRQSLTPLLPQAVRQTLRLMLGRTHPQRTSPWITPQFAHRIQLAERLNQKVRTPRFLSFGDNTLYEQLTNGSGIHGWEMVNRSAANFGLENRHPFNDRRLIEFAFALPEKQRRRQSCTKFVLRQAMNGIMPEMIRQRLTKAEFSHVFPKALQAQGGKRLFSSLNVATLGWVAEEQAGQMYQQMTQLYGQGNTEYTLYTWPLWMIFGIELWSKVVVPQR